MNMQARNTLLAAALALGFSLTAAGAQASLVLGSSVDSSIFSAAIGSTNGWTFLGTNTSAFTGSGTGTIDLRSAAFADSFGYAKDNHTSLTQVFASGANVGSTATIAGFSPSYEFYFASDAPGTRSISSRMSAPTLGPSSTMTAAPRDRATTVTSTT
jgi:hypothetical protein